MFAYSLTKPTVALTVLPRFTLPPQTLLRSELLCLDPEKEIVNRISHDASSIPTSQLAE